MDTQPPENSDPLAQLEAWGREVERRATRGHRIRSLGRVFRPSRVRRRALSTALALVVVAGLIGAYVRWGGHLMESHPVAYPTAAVPSGITATSGPTAAPVDKGPFAGTPADAFPSGAAGIVLPPAKAVGAWSAKDVSAALGHVRAALIASHLDHRLLIGHDASYFTAMLAPDSRAYITKDLKAGADGTSVIRIAASAHLAALAPRVSGRTTYRRTTWGQVPVLEVVTNYVWVYPFDTVAGSPASRVVVVHDEEQWDFPKPHDVRSAYQGTNLRSFKGYWDLMDCAQSDKGFTAPFSGVAQGVVPSPSDTEPMNNYFRPDHSLDIVSGCSQTS